MLGSIFDDVGDFFDDAWHAIDNNVLQPTVAVLDEAGHWVMKVVEDISIAITDTVSTVVDGLSKGISSIENAAKSFASFVQSVCTAIVDAVQAIRGCLQFNVTA